MDLHLLKTLTQVKHLQQGGDNTHLLKTLTQVKHLQHGGDNTHLVKTLTQVKHQQYGGDNTHVHRQTQCSSNFLQIAVKEIKKCFHV